MAKETLFGLTPKGEAHGTNAATSIWVYVKSEPGLYTVGFFDPAGKWQPDSDHQDREAAVRRTAWLNGSS